MTLIYDQTWKTKTFFVFVTIKLGKGGEGNRESGELSRMNATKNHENTQKTKGLLTTKGTKSTKEGHFFSHRGKR